MKHDRFKIAWAYIVEPVLALLVIVLGCLTMGVDAVSALVHQFAVDIAALYCTAFFAAALGFLWTFYSKADSQFCAWLDEKGAFLVYLQATAYVVAVEGGAIFVLLATKIFTGNEFALIAAFSFLMAIINSYTMVKNVIDIARLHTLFGRVARQ